MEYIYKIIYDSIRVFVDSGRFIYKTAKNEIMHNLRFALVMALSFPATVAFPQNTVKGIVCDADGAAALNAHVVLWHNDSIVAQGINSEHGFLLENVPDGVHILNISHVGYQTKQITLDVKRHLDLGTVPLTFGHELDEVVVKSARAVASYRNNLLHVSVRHTYLSELPNMESLLGNIPGVIMADDRLTYFGKGQILLLIDGREVKSLEEVSTLQPSQITEIVVDNMPGAKYDPRYSSVMDIRTTSEKPALMVYNTDTWARHCSGVAGFTSQVKAGNTLIDFAYGFRKRKNTLYSEQTEESFQPGNVFERAFTDTTFSNRMSHDWRIGTQSKLKTGTLNLKYTGYCSSNKPVYNSLMHHVSSAGQESLDILRTGKYMERQHLATLDYQVELTQEGILRVTADYLNQYSKDSSHATESSTDTEKRTDLDFHGRYNICSLLAEYVHSFGSLFKLSAGARYSHVDNRNASKENDVSTFYDLHENRCALYVEGSLQWKELAMQLGLRGERFDKGYRCTSQDATGYKDIFLLPSFSFSYKPSGSLQVSLSGNNKVFLPSFGELTPITTYLNQYSYMMGNPLLKPTVRYDFGIGAVWLDKLNLELEYSLVKDDRVAFSVADESNAQVLRYTYTNIDKARQFTGKLAYSGLLFRRHAVSLSAGILVPDVKVPYMDRYLHRTAAAYFSQLYCNWKIGQRTNFSASYTFQSKSYDKTDTYGATHNLGCNVSVVPIKDKLSISIQVSDILRRATGDWETDYGYIRTLQCNNADSRSISLSLRYTFNSLRPVRQGSSNSEEMDRL